MMKKYKSSEPGIPISCPDCWRESGYGTMIRNIKGDIYDEDGSIIWIGYICSACGHTTLRPVWEKSK